MPYENWLARGHMGFGMYYLWVLSRWLITMLVLIGKAVVLRRIEKVNGFKIRSNEFIYTK